MRLCGKSYSFAACILFGIVVLAASLASLLIKNFMFETTFIKTIKYVQSTTNKKSEFESNVNCNVSIEYDIVCECPLDYHGHTCEHYIGCTHNACLNGGTCAKCILKPIACCICAPGTTGKNCTDINECVSLPCQNGGTCNNKIGRYECHCTSFWWGTHCQNNVDECSSSPCLNGFCEDHNGRYTCHCFQGYQGNRCTDTTKKFAVVHKTLDIDTRLHFQNKITFLPVFKNCSFALFYVDLDTIFLYTSNFVTKSLMMFYGMNNSFSLTHATVYDTIVQPVRIVYNSHNKILYCLIPYRIMLFSKSLHRLLYREEKLHDKVKENSLFRFNYFKVHA